MFNYNPNIDYTKYKMRLCGTTWEYCNGKCNTCSKRNITYSTSTNIVPGLYGTTTNATSSYNTKNYTYTIDYLHRDSLTIPQSQYNYSRSYSGSIQSIDKELYCQTIGPWSYYREMYGWKGDLL